MGVYMRVDQQWWQPWANTIAYFPFETDILDHSGNSVTLNTSWYTYTQQAVGYLFVGNWWLGFNDSSVKFINVWMNIQTQTTPFGNGAYMNGGGLCYSAWHSQSRLRGVFVRYINQSSTDVSNKTNLSSWWHNFAIGYDDTATKCYLDWELFWTSSWLPYSFGNEVWLFSCWGNSNNSSAIISQWIIEDTERTAQEVSDYYNSTKANYGL
jgi:hypothetical protein